MGGRPSKQTSKDMRLSRNNPNAGKKAQSKPMQNQPPSKKGGGSSGTS